MHWSVLGMQDICFILFINWFKSFFFFFSLLSLHFFHFIYIIYSPLCHYKPIRHFVNLWKTLPIWCQEQNTSSYQGNRLYPLHCCYHYWNPEPQAMTYLRSENICTACQHWLHFFKVSILFLQTGLWGKISCWEFPPYIIMESPRKHLWVKTLYFCF